MQLIGGIDPDGKPKAIATDADGKMQTTGNGEGGGGGDASAANQETQIQRETEIRDRLTPAGTISRYLGTANTANLKSSAGTVYSFTCSNNNNEIRWFQIFNQTTAAINDNVPVIAFPVFPNNGVTVIGEEIFGAAGLTLTTGISWAFSSTRLTCTLATATDCIALVRWT